MKANAAATETILIEADIRTYISIVGLGSCVWVRYMGVIRFEFHVLQLLSIRFTQQNLCNISKSIMKHHQKSDLP